MSIIQQPGDFQLCPTGGAVGVGIRIGQWLDGAGFENFEHVRVYIGDGQFVEAEPGGAIRTVGVINWGVWSTGLIPLTPGERNTIVGAALNFADMRVGYGWLDYFAIAAHRFDLPVPGLQGFIGSTKTMICSQLVDQCYDDAGVHLFTDGRWPGYVTPGAMYQLLVSKGLKSPGPLKG